MKLHLNYRTIMFMSIIVFLKSNIVMAQIPTAGKYNTTNYPKDRKAIEALGYLQDSTVYLKDDYISVGAEGKVYYGKMQEENSFKKYDLKFKSVIPFQGTVLLRIFDGKTDVSSAILNVVFSSPKGDLHVNVIRSTTYVKQKGKWYMVFGQGTRVQTDVEIEESMRKSLQIN